MKKQYFGFILYVIFLFSCGRLSGQVVSLNRIGQTPGSAGFHVNWDSTAKRLIVGCGTSIWIYDMGDPQNYSIIAKRPFLGLINETEVYGDVLFAAATHDGVYALDYNSHELDVLAHYDMQGMGDTAAYDMWRTNDTLYIADNFRVRMLKYIPGTGFVKLGSFGPPNAFCVARRGDYIAVGGQGVLYLTPDTAVRGNIHIYHKNNLNTPVAVWQSELVSVVQDIQFADRNDSIIYVCAGPEEILFYKSNFFALNFATDTLFPADTFSLSGGILGFAQLNIMNMDSQNDTLFLVTTAATNTSVFPAAYMPIIDATGLPADSMRKIGYVIPGLWHFDAALMDGTPYIAMSSEWCGVLVSNISQLQPADTLGFLETGGWCVNNHLQNGSLWACHEGYGLVAYNTDSLKYVNGFDTRAQLMHIYDVNNHFFCSDIAFLNDSLMMVNSSEVYNIKPWLSGGTQQLAWDMNKNYMTHMNVLQTNARIRMVASYDNLLGKQWITLFDPFDSGGSFHDLALDSMNSDSRGIAVSGDTVYYGKTINNIHYLCAQHVYNDGFMFLDTIKLSLGFFGLFDDEIHSISIENGIIAVAYGAQFAWFNWVGGALNELAMDFKFGQRAMGLELKNKYLYVADRFFGLKVYDISSMNSAVLVAECRGTGGWKNLYGSGTVTVGPDGTIYLTDFHAGVIMIEPFDHTLGTFSEKGISTDDKMIVYPNPAEGMLNIDFVANEKGRADIEIYDLYGKKISASAIMNCNRGKNHKTINLKGLPAATYVLVVRQLATTRSAVFGICK
ncbi:MAG TPA: T9SS type A sorting domain-containing protein [Bacteroidales bacterium]|nr:T9SS type A sorting domain-containing protein [Bacteroidales bacterium]HPB24447.1 T9SS type A sorting domain-containing protein [Bacteroidales bacterium]HPI29286.1 T9SS type A sorting domain-containing protein [Bacteroidales bacterium]HQN15068.1 T9SS type A sorting domain-containing protein [Bacteroidales bacterium]HQP15766.1 T9SS type A sorting domain-containing protein [Bacteroidales bacterium]